MDIDLEKLRQYCLLTYSQETIIIALQSDISGEGDALRFSNYNHNSAFVRSVSAKQFCRLLLFYLIRSISIYEEDPFLIAIDC